LTTRAGATCKSCTSVDLEPATSAGQVLHHGDPDSVSPFGAWALTGRPRNVPAGRKCPFAARASSQPKDRTGKRYHRMQSPQNSARCAHGVLHGWTGYKRAPDLPEGRKSGDIRARCPCESIRRRHGLAGPRAGDTSFPWPRAVRGWIRSPRLGDACQADASRVPGRRWPTRLRTILGSRTILARGLEHEHLG
jgi:hypothetical protein